MKMNTNTESTNIKRTSTKTYAKELITIGLPITLQSVLQASYGFADQIMVGTLGTMSIAGSGLTAKYGSLVNVTVSSVAVAASILIAQYYGKKDETGITRSYRTCFALSGILAIIFALLAILLPQEILRIYTTDQEMIQVAKGYFAIIGISFLPMTATLMFSSYDRSVGKSQYPMHASVISLVLNLLFNYLFIFGKCGMPKLGLWGAGLGTLLARIVEMMILFIITMRIRTSERNLNGMDAHVKIPMTTGFMKKVLLLTAPILLNEFSWSVGENIYAIIYGRIGTEALAAITLTNPLQALFIGLFSGIASAAVVMVGQRLGKEEMEDAVDISGFLLKAGVVGACITSGLLLVIAPIYFSCFTVSAEVMKDATYLIYALAVLLPVKISNMILAGGILRAGGKTKLTFYIDMIGTWIFGVPLGLLTAFVFGLPVYWVYLILSMEEVVRLLIAIYFYKKKAYVQSITEFA